MLSADLVRQAQETDTAPLLSVVVPMYNESRRLGRTLEHLTTYLAAQSYAWEVLLVDDGSRDDSVAIARDWASRWRQIRVLVAVENRGKGDAVRRGVLAARGEYILFTDADLATPIGEVERLLPQIEAGADVVVGSRAMPDSVVLVEQGPLRRLMGTLFRLLVWILCRTNVRDSQCGFKLFRTPIARHLFAQLQTRRFAFDVELLLLAQALGYRVREAGVMWIDQRFSTVSWRDPWQMLHDIWRLRSRTYRRLDTAVRRLPTEREPVVAVVTVERTAGVGARALHDAVPAAAAGRIALLRDAPRGAVFALMAVLPSEVEGIIDQLALAGGEQIRVRGAEVFPLATSLPALEVSAAETVAHLGERPVTAVPGVHQRMTPESEAWRRERAAWARRRRVVRPLILLNLIGLGWWLAWLYNLGHAANPVLYGLLVAAESFSVVQVLGYWYTVWHDPRPERRRKPAAGTVDVFIPTYDEPVSVVARTVRAAASMPYPHRTYVLDDGNRPEIGALAERLGAHWITRPDNRGAKAGNINHALARTEGDFIAVFDSDHAPRRDFLDRLMPYMAEPDVAFVQTPQYYVNRDKTYVAGGAMEQQEIFFGPICRGKDGLGAVFCCGTNMVLRRAAIAEIGGFREDSVVEDAATSLDLHERGWRSRYVPERLADGLAPEDMSAYLSQQDRWARGNLDLLLHGRILRRHMPLRLRFQYLWSAMYYLTGLSTVVYLALPIFFLLFGTETVSAHSRTFIAHFLPYLFLTIFILARSTEGRLRFRAIQLSYGLFPVFIGALWASLTGRKGRFVVTPKEGSSQGFYRLVVPQLAIIGISLLAIAVGLIHYSGARTITNIAWAAFDILMLSGSIRAAAPQPLDVPLTDTVDTWQVA